MNIHEYSPRQAGHDHDAQDADQARPETRGDERPQPALASHKLTDDAISPETGFEWAKRNAGKTMRCNT